MEITPAGPPAPITATFGFSCKWCGEDRRVIYGYSDAHTCAVYHSANEDLAFVLEQVRIHEGRPTAAETYAWMRAEAEAAITTHGRTAE